MNVMKSFYFSVAAAMLLSATLHAAEPTPESRTLKICVAADAPAEVKQSADLLAASVESSPLLKTLAGSHKALRVNSADLLAAAPTERAYHHLIVVGLPDDPLVKALWQREARIETGGMYVFGFGHLSGTLGYVESDRNPYMHSAAIKIAPYETEVITITGSNPQGVALAAKAFINLGLTNGVIAGGDWRRSSATVLDHDPLSASATLPSILPAQAGPLPRIAVSQAGEDEYRGVLADVGVEPLEIWRAKYHRSGSWDGAGAQHAFAHYSAGLHRRAYGDTLWAARFESKQMAAQAAAKIAAAANLQQKKGIYMGDQPPYANVTYAGETKSAGPLTLWQSDTWVLMSTLPIDATKPLLPH